MIFTQGSPDDAFQKLITSVHSFWMFSADFSFSFSTNSGNFNDGIPKTLHPCVFLLFFLPERFFVVKQLFHKVMI